MARYHEDNRETLQFLMGSLDQLLPQDSVARAIWAGLERLDFSAYDARYKNDAVGRSALNPRCLTAVWALGMLRGVTSSVRLAMLCGHDVEFRWLVGDARVEKSTLCDFRKNHGESLVSLSAQVLSALGQHGLLPGEHMGVDGAIVRASSSRHSVKNRKRLARRKSHLEEVLRDRLSQGDCDVGSAEVQWLERRRQRLSQALDEMTSQGLAEETDRLTVTEPEATLKRHKDGSYAPGYNAQVVTDLESGAIVHAQVVDSGNDSGQLQPQLERAQRVLSEVGGAARQQGVQSVTADGAYHDTLQLDALERQKVACYVPEDRGANRTPPGVSPAYRAGAFVYDEKTDTMVCPQGHALKRRKVNNAKTSVVYQAATATCQACPAKAQCCPKSKQGRCVNRTLYKHTLERVAQRLETDAGRGKKHARWVVCEGVFARLNGLLHWGRCRMWGKAGAEAELLWRQFIANLLLLTGVWKPLVPAGNPAG
jgi:transposase